PARPAFNSRFASSEGLLACRLEARSTLPNDIFSPPSRFASSEDWRRGRDSNPRWAFTQSGFQDRRDRPLCHLSVSQTGLPSRSSPFISCPSRVAGLARQEGLEPPTNGFGDRYST